MPKLLPHCHLQVRFSSALELATAGKKRFNNLVEQFFTSFIIRIGVKKACCLNHFTL